MGVQPSPRGAGRVWGPNPALAGDPNLPGGGCPPMRLGSHPLCERGPGAFRFPPGQGATPLPFITTPLVITRAPPPGPMKLQIALIKS